MRIAVSCARLTERKSKPMAIIQRVLAAVIQRNDQYLLCQRPALSVTEVYESFPAARCTMDGASGRIGNP